MTIAGTGFDAGSRVCLPVAVATTFVSSVQVQADVPANFAGADGGAVQIGVFVLGADGSASNVWPFTVTIPASRLQAYTTIDAVCAEVPGFMRGGQIDDDSVQRWISSVAQVVKGSMLKRGLSLDPADWQQAGADGTPAATEVLEMINRLGAAARLASAVVSLFGNADAAFSRNLQSAFKDELGRLEGGSYDKAFSPAASTAETGPLLSYGDTSRADGEPTTMFRKETKF